MSLPEWLLLVSPFLALAVLLAVLARRVRLPLTMVVAVVGFVAAWVGHSVGAKFPLEGEQFEDVNVGGKPHWLPCESASRGPGREADVRTVGTRNDRLAYRAGLRGGRGQLMAAEVGAEPGK